MQITNQAVIREALVDDYGAIADVMFDAVRHGRSEYTEGQRRAWVPQSRSGVDWVERLDSQAILVATKSTEVIGFMSLATNGYIDFAYIRPSAQRSGVFRRLYESNKSCSYSNASFDVAIILARRACISYRSKWMEIRSWRNIKGRLPVLLLETGHQ